MNDESDSNQGPWRKLHEHLVKQVVMALMEIFKEDKYADKTIEKFLKKNRKWGSRDRKFFAETVYETVRWWRKYFYLATKSEPTAGKITEENVWKVWAIHWTLQGNKVPAFLPVEAPYFSDLEKYEKNLPTLGLQESLPDWLDKKGEAEFGKNWPRVVFALNEPALVYLRANVLVAEPEDVIEALADEGIEAFEVTDFKIPHALRLAERKNVHATKAFRDGMFEVQDGGSQYIAEFLQIKPGLRVIDACAGAGGKSLHIASLMKNKGKVISMDIYDWKLTELKARAKRNKIDVIETKLIDSTKVIKRLEKTADRLLLDVPCSGLGVLKRNPDAKWKLKEEEIANLVKTQEEILENYSGMTKVGGLMVYATCSIFSEENEKQIEKFLAKNGAHWTLKNEIHLRPDIQGYDGFYMALLERKE